MSMSPYYPAWRYLVPVDADIELTTIGMDFQDDGMVRMQRFGQIHFEVERQRIDWIAKENEDVGKEHKSANACNEAANPNRSRVSLRSRCLHPGGGSPYCFAPDPYFVDYGCLKQVSLSTCPVA